MKFPIYFVIHAVLCCGVPTMCGNRADVNADQTVNATDIAVLSNILAGNLNLEDYGLSNVVVVASQGGDFTDPADAADWVASQSPTDSHPFIIQIAPGEYELDRPITMPSHTLLRGSSVHNTTVRRAGGALVFPYNALVIFDDSSQSGIENLRLFKSTGGTGLNLGVLITNTSAFVEFDHVEIEIYNNGPSAIGLLVEDSAPTTIRNSNIVVDGQFNPSTNTVMGVFLDQSNLTISYSSVSALNLPDTGTRNAYCVYMNASTYKALSANFSTFFSTSGSFDNYFLFRPGPEGFAQFQFCYLYGDTNRTIFLNLTMCNDP